MAIQWRNNTNYWNLSACVNRIEGIAENKACHPPDSNRTHTTNTKIYSLHTQDKLNQTHATRRTLSEVKAAPRRRNMDWNCGVRFSEPGKSDGRGWHPKSVLLVLAPPRRRWKWGHFGSDSYYRKLLGKLSLRSWLRIDRKKWFIWTRSLCLASAAAFLPGEAIVRGLRRSRTRAATFTKPTLPFLSVKPITSNFIIYYFINVYLNWILKRIVILFF